MCGNRCLEEDNYWSTQFPDAGLVFGPAGGNNDLDIFRSIFSLPPSLTLTMSKGSILYVKGSMFPGSWLKFAAVLAATFTFLSILLLKLNTCVR